MMEFSFIGTSHIAAQSVREIVRGVAEEAPDIVALELDPSRAAALMQKQPRKMSLKSMGQIGIKGYLFARLGQMLQQRLGKMVGVSPGSEMKAALEEARKRKIDIALIDQPIQVTLKRFSQTLTWREKFRFVMDVLKGALFPQRQLRELGLEKFDLRRVPEKKLIQAMMRHLKERYPTVYHVLVEERNRHMVKQLVRLQQQHPRKKILVIVGAGHVDGMKELLRKVEVVG